MPCCAEDNDTGSTGLVSIASPVSTSRHAGFCIPIRRSASSRHDLRQEPYAVTLHVRICAGGGQQWPSLPRPNIGGICEGRSRRCQHSGLHSHPVHSPDLPAIIFAGHPTATVSPLLLRQNLVILS